jgi:hypothetical protein
MAVVWNDNGTIAYSSSLQAVYRTQTSPTTPRVRPEISLASEFVPWGSDNLFPQHIIEKVRKSTLIPSTLVKQAHMLQSSGLVYGRVTGYDKDGNEEMEYVYDPEVESWMKRTNVKRYLREASLSYHWFYNLFPELVVSRDRKIITSIHSQRPEYCRWQKQNDRSGYVDHCFISANWESSSDVNDKKYVTKVPTIDPYYDAIDALRERNDFKVIYPLSYPSPGTSFYQLAPWTGAVESGWLDVSISVAAWKKALFTNQIGTKYIIEVSTWWWNWQYPGFDQMNHEEKKKIQDNELDMFEKFMTGPENNGKSIMTTYQSDPIRGTKYDGWAITPIPNPIKDGMHNEDSQEASSHLLYALGWDPTLTGPVPGKTGMGAGAGSDKRVASEIYLSMIEPNRDVVLEPLQFIFDYNWPDRNYKLKFRNARVTTLDQGKGLATEIPGTAPQPQPE